MLIISLFLTWYGFSLGALGQIPGVPKVDTSWNGWTMLSPGDLFLLFVGLIAILPAASYLSGLEIKLPFPLGLTVLGTAGLALVYIALKMIFRPETITPLGAIGLPIVLSIRYGLVFALIAAAVAAFGGWLIMHEDGPAAVADSSPPRIPPAPPASSK